MRANPFLLHLVSGVPLVLFLLYFYRSSHKLGEGVAGWKRTVATETLLAGNAQCSCCSKQQESRPSKYSGIATWSHC